MRRSARALGRGCRSPSVFYVALSAALVRQLDRKNEQLALTAATEERLAQIGALLDF
jgi:hypothetical protein